MKNSTRFGEREQVCRSASCAEQFTGPPSDLTADFIPLFHDAMLALGPAAQTFGAMTRLASEGRSFQTFAAQRLIAEKACLPDRTVREHLRVLVSSGWLKGLGRQQFGRSPRRRRTVTYEIPEEVLAIADPDQRAKFAVLPRFAARRLSTWGQRAVYAVAASRHLLIVTIDESGSGQADDRYWITLRQFEKATGLDRRTIVAARAALVDVGAISLDANEMRLTADFVERADVAGLEKSSKANAKGEKLPATTAKPAGTRAKAAGSRAFLAGQCAQNLPAERAKVAGASMTSFETSHSETSFGTNVETSGQHNATTAGTARRGDRVDQRNTFSFGQPEALYHRFRTCVGCATDDDRDFLWRVACLVGRGDISEGAATSAAQGTLLAGPTKDVPVAYFRTCLVEKSGAEGEKVNRLLSTYEPPFPRPSGRRIVPQACELCDGWKQRESASA